MSPKTPRIVVIILNWNGLDDTLECLHSVMRIDYPSYDIYVADNGSTDGSIPGIRAQFPALKLIENGANLGFAEGNNRAIQQAIDTDAEFVLLLNNDTVIDSNLLSAFVRAAEMFPDGGVFGPKIYHYGEKEKIWYAGGYWDASTLSFEEKGAGCRDEGQFDQLAETEWVIGCAMFIRADVFRKIGLLEAKFFLNSEEIDFCSRAQRAGFSCVFVPDAQVWHKISVSFGGEHSPMKEYFSARNRLLWAKRNASYSLRLRIHISTARNLFLRFGLPVVKVRPGAKLFINWWWAARTAFRDPRNRAYYLGVRDYWRGQFGNCPDTIRQLTKHWAAARAKAEPIGLVGDKR